VTEPDIFEQALSAAEKAFSTTLNDHFGRTFDLSDADEARLMDEYRAAARDLRDGGVAVHLRTGLVDADFHCWLSVHADENFGQGAARAIGGV
jgi:hypothetical protein